MRAPVLGIDFGTSNTAGVIHRSGPAAPLLFEGSPLLPSAVYLDAETGLLVGRDAERSAAVAPGQFEPNPKRRIDDGTIWLGERDVPVVEAVAAVLARVAGEANRVTGQPPGTVVLTRPVDWGRPRQRILADAAVRAGLGEPRFVAEPVAAASYLVDVLGQRVPVGQCLVVYDLGAGTFDVAVVRRTEDGFAVLAADGLADVGGLDLDAAVVEQVRSATAGSVDAWGRIDWPESTADRRARRLLWQDARAAKEQLSRHSTAALHVPLVDTDWHLTRAEFEALARPLLERTVRLTIATLRASKIGPDAVSGLFLVGGASRVPLVATLLHSALRIAPTVIEQPELVVAIGAVHASEAAAPVVDPELGASDRPSSDRPVTDRPATVRATAQVAEATPPPIPPPTPAPPPAARPATARASVPARKAASAPAARTAPTPAAGSASTPALDTGAAAGRGDRLLRWIGRAVAVIVAVAAAARVLLVQGRVERGYLTRHGALPIAGEIALDILLAVIILVLTRAGGARARAGVAVLAGWAALQVADLPRFLEELDDFGPMSAAVGMRAAPLQGLLLMVLAIAALLVLPRRPATTAPAVRPTARITVAVVVGALASAVPLAAYRVDPDSAVTVTAWVIVVAAVVAVLPVLAVTRRSPATGAGMLVAYAALIPAPALSGLFRTGATPPAQSLLLVGLAVAVLVLAATGLRIRPAPT